MNNTTSTKSTNTNETPKRRIRHISEVIREQQKKQISFAKDDDYPPIITTTTTLGC